MSLVSSRLQLTQRATVMRDAGAGTPDDWGSQQPTPNWQSHIPDLACRAWTSAGREAVDATTIAVVEDMRLLCSLDTDVTEADRIDDVTERGDVVIAGPVGIQAVLRHKDHLELVLTRIG